MENEMPLGAAPGSTAAAVATVPEPLANPAGDPAIMGGFILARFRRCEALDQALHQLEVSGFGREDLALPDLDAPPERSTPEAGTKPADDDVESQQSRLVHSAVGGSFAAMMAATAVAATGGVAAAVAGAALGVGAAVAGVAHLMSRALDHSERQSRERKAAEGRLFLAVRTVSPERRERAIEVLRQAGGELL
jgi:hypothetical protein